MQSYKDPQSSPGTRGPAPPITMTMSLNGPPGYHMQPPAMHGYLPHQPGALDGGAVVVGGGMLGEVAGPAPGVGGVVDPSRTQREQYVSQHQQPQSRSKQPGVGGGAPVGVAGGGGGSSSSSGGGAGGGEGMPYRARPDQMQQLAAQTSMSHQHMLHHQQRQQQQQQQHGMSGNHMRSSAVSMHSPQQHQHHIHHQQPQQHHPSQHHGAPQPVPMGYLSEKDSRASSGVFKTPPSVGYSVPAASAAAAVGQQMTNGIPGMHQQYAGYHMMKDASPMRSEVAMMDSMKQRMSTGSGGSVSAMSPRGQAAAGTMAAYRHGSSSGSDAGRHHPQQADLHSPQHHQQQQQHLMMHSPQQPSSQQQSPQQQQHFSQHQQQPPPPHLQTVPHAVSQSSHYPAQQKAMMSPTGHVPQHAVPQSSMSLPMPHRGVAPSHGQPTAAGVYGQTATAPPPLLPPGHPTLSPVTQESHTHHHHHHHPQPHQPQQPVLQHHRPSTSPTPPTAADLYCRTSPASAAALASRHPPAMESSMAMHADGAKQLVSMRAQPSVGSIRTGEPRIQAQAAAGSSARSAASGSLAGMGGGAGLGPPHAISKGSIQMGTPAGKPVVINTEVKVSAEMTRGCKVSPGTNAPLDLSKIRADPARPGDCPLDLSVKPHKRPSDDVCRLEDDKDMTPHSLVKKPRSDASTPSKSSYDLGFPYPLNPPVADGHAAVLAGQHAKPSVMPVRSDHHGAAAVPAMTYPAAQGFKGHVTAPGMSGYIGAGAGLPASVAVASAATPQKITHGHAYPPSDRVGSHSRSNSRGSTPLSRPHSIEMAYEGKSDDLSSLMPKIVKGITASPPIMISSLHSQLERVQQMKPEGMSGHGHAVQMKHQLPHQQLQQQMLQRDVPPYAMNGSEKHRMAVSDVHAQKSVSMQQQQMQRHQACCPPKTSQSITMGTPKSASHGTSHVTSEPHGLDFPASQQLMTGQPHPHYHQKYHHQPQQQSQLKQHHPALHRQHSQQQQQQQQQQRMHLLHEQQKQQHQTHRQQSQKQHTRDGKYGTQQQLQQGIVGSPYMYDMAVREHDIHKVKQNLHGLFPDGVGEEMLSWRPPEMPGSSSAQSAAGGTSAEPHLVRHRSDKQQHPASSSIAPGAGVMTPSPSLRQTKVEDKPGSEDSRGGYCVRRCSSENVSQEAEKHRSADGHNTHQSNSSAAVVQEKDIKNVEMSTGAALDAGASADAGDGRKQAESVSSDARLVTMAGPREQVAEEGRPSLSVPQDPCVVAEPTLAGRNTPVTPKLQEGDAFQRPHPVAAGGVGVCGGASANLGVKKPFDAASQAEVLSKETPSVKSENSSVASPASSDDFTTPLSISIPNSPALEPGTKQALSPVPPPPKMLPRKRMILNAYNKDETMRKFGSPAVKTDMATQGSSSGKSEHQRLRHFSSSPPPSSPKMPILSPQEKGNEADLTSAQNDDPPKLDPSTPVRGRSVKSSANAVRGGGPGSGSSGSGTLATGGGNSGGSGGVVATAQTPSPHALAQDSNTTGKLPAAAGSVAPSPDLEAAQDKIESVVVRRYSLTAADACERLADPAAQQQQQAGQVPVPFNRSDGSIRRDSLERPWGHPQKIIPVANVAPFVHNKSAAELSPREYPDVPRSSRVSDPSPHDIGPPKSEDRKVSSAAERKQEPVRPEGGENKSSSPASLQDKDLPSSEKRRLAQRSKPVKKTCKLLKKLANIGKNKGQAADLHDDLGVEPLKYKVLKSSHMFDVHDLEGIQSAERKEKNLKRKISKHKHALKSELQAAGEKAKAGDHEEEREEREEDEEEATQTSESTPEKSKKDLAQSREERANRRAMLRREEEVRSGRKQQKGGKRTARQRLSSTNQKARELKRSALARRPRRETTKRKSGQYNRNAAYEEEIKRDESRKAIRRARRHASNLARERLQQQHNDATDAADDDNSQDDAQSLPRDDEPWDLASTFSSSSRPSRKSKSARGTLGHPAPDPGQASCTAGTRAPSKHVGSAVESSDVDEEYFNDADDESKDVSDDEDGADAEFADGNSPSSRGKSKSLCGRKKKRGKTRLRRKNPESCFDDDNFESGREDTLLYGEDTVELNGSHSTLPVPPEVKRIAVNKNSGETLLHRAARLGNEEVTLYCLRSGEYNVNARDNAGYTALHESCVKGSVRVARHLILHGADVNCCSLDGIRPLHDAVENDHVEVARLLLSHGADPLIATYGGKTPLKIARSLTMLDVIKGYLGDLNGYGSEEERPWQMPGSYGLHAGTGNPDNGFDIFAGVPSDDEEVDLDGLFDDGITASIATYLLPADDGNSNPQPVVLQDDVLRQLRIPFKHFSAMSCCMSAQVHVTRPHILRMLEHSVLRRGSLHHHALLESDKLRLLPVSVLRKVEVSLEQLVRRPASKTSGSSSSSSTSGSCSLLPDLQGDSDTFLIRHLGEMSLTQREDGATDDAEDDDVDSKDGRGRRSLKCVTSRKVAVPDGKQEVASYSLCEKSGTLWIKTEKAACAGVGESLGSACSPLLPALAQQRHLAGEGQQPGPQEHEAASIPDNKISFFRLHGYRSPPGPGGAEDRTQGARCQNEKFSPLRATSAPSRGQGDGATSCQQLERTSASPSCTGCAPPPARPATFLLKAPHFQPNAATKEHNDGEAVSCCPSALGAGGRSSSPAHASRPASKPGGPAKGVGSAEGSGGGPASTSPTAHAGTPSTWGSTRSSGRRATTAGGVVIASASSGGVAKAPGHATSTSSHSSAASGVSASTCGHTSLTSGHSASTSGHSLSTSGHATSTNGHTSLTSGLNASTSVHSSSNSGHSMSTSGHSLSISNHNLLTSGTSSTSSHSCSGSRTLHTSTSRPSPGSSPESSDLPVKSTSLPESCASSNGTTVNDATCRESKPLSWPQSAGRSSGLSKILKDPSQENRKSPGFSSNSNSASSRDALGSAHLTSSSSPLASGGSREAGRESRGGKSPSAAPATFSNAFTQFVKDLPPTYGESHKSDARTCHRSGVLHGPTRRPSQENASSSPLKRSGGSCPSSLSSSATSSSAASSHHHSGKPFSKEAKGQSQVRHSHRQGSGRKREAEVAKVSLPSSILTTSSSFTSSLSGKSTPVKDASRSPHWSFSGHSCGQAISGSGHGIGTLGPFRNGSTTTLVSTPAKLMPPSSSSSSLLPLSSSSFPASGASRDCGNKEQRAYHSVPILGESPALSGLQEAPCTRVEVRTKNPPVDFGQMFSDESSSSSFTTVVDSLDYDSSHSPVASAGVTTANGTNSSNSSSSGLEVNASGQKHSISTSSSFSASAKHFSFGMFGRGSSGKDTNDNDINLFPRTKP